MFKATKSFRFIVVVIAIISLVTLGVAANWSGVSAFSFFSPFESAGRAKVDDKTKLVAAPLEDLSENVKQVEQKYDSDGNKIEMPVSDAPTPPSTDAITTATYAFSSAAGASLEDMSSGTTTLVGNNLDDTASGLTILPFDFWFDGVRANQFSVNANGEMRLGNTVVGSTFSNALGSTTDAPKLAPYWDDLWVGFNGKIHYKTVGTAPNRKLVVEWQNMQVPRVANGSTGGATFQAWLYEGTGVIEYVYGNGLGVNSVQSGYSVGIQSGAATNFASVTTATNTVSYATANDTNTGAITAGTKYTFTPVAPTAPSGLNFTAVTGTSMTLNWTDNSSNEAGFLIYRSTDGVNYTFITQTAVNAVTSTQNNLGNNQTYSWRVIAVSEGAVSTTLSGSQATTTGTVSGTKSVGPTGDYASLTAAFADITTNGLAGNVILELQSTYVSSVETFPIVPSVNGSLAATITVRPATGATGLSIAGSGATIAGLIDLNGSRYVTFDGRPGGTGTTRDLTISNTSTAGPTVRLINGAVNNTLKYLQLRGVQTTTSTIGVVNFSTSTAVTGNNNNTIDNCDVRDGATAPVNGITSTGTTTLGLENNNNTVSNNSIFNFFSATTDHNGILLGAGNTNWTISGNSIYNTNGPLNITTSSVVWNGIQFSSATGSWGHTISGNSIGGTAPSLGGGALTFTGAGVIRATRLTTGAQIPTSLQGNTIGNFNLTSSSTSTGGAGLGMISGAFNAGDITPNIVSNWTLNITGAGTLWRGISVGTGTAAVTVVSNNVVSNITNASTSVAQFQGIGIQGAAPAMTISGNTVGSTTNPNDISMSAAATSFFGFTSSASGATTYNFTNNTVANATSTGTGIYNMIGMSISSGGYNISGNTIRNLTTASTTTSSTTIGINATATTSVNQVISQNTIRSLNMTAPAAGVVGFGIIYTGPTTGASVVSRNKINSITAATTTTTAALEGIRITAGNATFQNNMVRLGFFDDATPTSITTGIAINGISETGGTNNIYHNSVYIGGTGVVSASNTTAFFSSLTSGTRAVRDNIFANNRQNASGTATNTGALFGTALTIPAPTGLTMSNNVYFSFDPAATVRNGSAGTSYSVSGWQGASSVDAGSLYSSLANINFVAPNGTSATVDLHVASPTVIEGNGVDVGVLDDFDGQTRSGLTPVDVGADAGAFTGVDLAPPVITYTAFTNTTSTSNRILAITATDATGVDQTATFLPRIYFKKSTDGAYVSTQCVSSGGTAQNGTYNCTIDYTLVGGGTVTAGETIQYFAVAQDTAGNVGSNPAGVVAPSVNSITTPPTPNTYNISAAISGTINVGTGETFTSLTNTGGIFEAINAGALTGNVTINLTSDLAAELGTVALNQWAEDGVGGYTMLIKPSGAPRTITGSNTSALIRLNGADRVRFDGSTAATLAAPDVVGGNPALRELTIQNTNVGTSAVVVSVGSNGTNGAQNNTIQNVNILGQDPTTTLLGISLGGATPGTAGTDNDNNRVENCSVKRSIFGIYSAGASLANQNTGTVITQNETSAVVGDRIRRIGIAVFNENGVQITENSINGISTNESADAIGIGVGTQGIDNTNITGGGVTNALVARNKIDGVASLSAVGFSAAGITVAGATGGANTIQNNMISGVTSPATSPDIMTGIYVVGATGSSTRLYHNTVSLTGDRGVVAGQTPSFGVAITGTDPTVELKNNIFHTTQIASGGGVNAKSYAIGMVTTTFANLDSNYNDFWSAGANDGGFRSGSLTTAAGTDYATVALWAAAVSDDANSIEADPAFVSATDLHLQPSPANPLLINGGTTSAIGGVTNDIDGDTRPSGSATDIGADEIVESADLSITKTDSSTTATAGTTVSYTLGYANAGPSSATTVVLTETVPVGSTFNAGASTAGWVCTPNGNAGSTCTFAVGTVANAGSGSATFAINVLASATGSLVNTATISSATTDPTPGNNSATDTDTIGQSADLAITKTDGATTATPGTGVSYTLGYSNAGPSDAASVVLTETVPVGSTFNAGGSTAGWVCAPNNNAGSTCTFAVGAVASAGSGSATFAVNVLASATGTLVNTASISSAATDPTPGNNSATDTDTIVGSADLSITKTNGVTTVTAGGSATYTITALNAGPSNTTATVADTFPGIFTGTWTCVGAAGGTCTAAGMGNINDAVTLPSGGSVTYTVSGTISASATGSLSNTATVTGAATDPTPGNNTATDTDTITTSADLSITKTDGVAQYLPGGTVTYTITASNAGPSNVPSAAIVDNFPAQVASVSWTCVGAGGGVCNANGMGNINETANLPSGGSVTFTATATISGGATGSMSNTATVSGGAVTDPTPGNNSATDTDTLAPASVQFSSATYIEDESQTANIIITRTIDTSGISTVQFSAAAGAGGIVGGAPGSCGTPGVDFETVTNQLVTFIAGDAEETVTVKICGGDTDQEFGQTIALSLTAPTGAGLGSPATATLNVNETASQYLQSPEHTPIDMFFATVANPYPSQITVSGAPMLVGTMRVTLYDVSQAFPDNMDVLLVGPLGQKYLLVADTGGPGPISPDAPVTLTFSDFAGGHLPDTANWTTGTFLPTVCDTNSVFAPTAPAGPYVTPNCTTPNTLAQTMFGSGGTGFGLTNPNGTWSLYVRDDAGQLRPIGDDTANFAVGRIAGGWGLEFLAPTAADVSIGGRVLTGEGRGIRGARVTVTGNSLASPITVTTGVNGRYTIPGLTAGETYVVTVSARRFFFEAPSRVITLNDNVTDADFTGSAGTSREQ